MLMSTLLVCVLFIASFFVSFSSFLILWALVIVFVIVFKLVVRGLFYALLVNGILDHCCVLSS